MTDNNKIEEAKEKIFEKHFRNQNEDFVCIDHIKEPVYLDYQIKQAIELGAKCMQKDRQEGLKLLHQIQHLLFGLHINSEMKVFSNRSNKK